MTSKRAEPETIAIISVHGTNDGAESDAGEKWWQQDSSFSRALLSALRKRGLEASHVAFHWGGANSDLDRRKGAEALGKTIRQCRRRYASTHIVAHSHGGNVANMAASACGWGRARSNVHLASVITVGTPFLRRRVGALEYLSAFLFLLVALVSIPLWVHTTVTRFAETGASRDLAFWGTLLIGGAAIVASILLTVQTAASGVRRVTQPEAHLRSANAILAIRHPQDEAISFLQKVDTVRLEPIPRGALWRGSNNLAVALSAPIVNVLAFCLLASAIYFTASGNVSIRNELAAIFAIACCGLFCALYLMSRLAFGAIPELLLRNRLNARIVNTLRGLALGSDGVQRLGEVAIHSHSLRTEEAPLMENVAARMKTNAAAQAGKLIEKYRWSLFTADTDTGRALADIAEDALTWESLIHTTYFDQPEVTEMIADHIAQQTRSRGTPKQN